MKSLELTAHKHGNWQGCHQSLTSLRNPQAALGGWFGSGGRFVINVPSPEINLGLVVHSPLLGGRFGCYQSLVATDHDDKPARLSQKLNN